MEGALAIILAFAAAYLAIVLVWYVLSVIADWKIFTKAGEAGWKSRIPIDNSYVQYRITWDVKFFWISIALGVAGTVLGYFGDVMDAIGTLCMAAGGIIGIIGLYKLSKAYGHGVGFTIGLVLLNPIFLLILGLGSSEYQGPQ